MLRDTAKQLVIEGCHALSGLDAWIDAGTLLGLYRQRDFIPHDTDVDFAIALSCSQANQIPKLIGSEYYPVRAIYWRGLPMQNAYLFNGEVLDFYFFYDDIKSGFLTNVSDGGVMEIPEELIRPIARNFSWESITLPMPNQVDNYLKWRYGNDWKTPKQEKQSWSLDHPNIRPRAHAKSLDIETGSINPSNWEVGNHILGQSKYSNQELDMPEIAVFDNGSLLSLWAARNTLLAERDSLLAERDSLLSSGSWRITSPLRFFVRALRWGNR